MPKESIKRRDRGDEAGRVLCYLPRRLLAPTLILTCLLIGLIAGVAWDFDYDHATWMGIH